MASSYGGRGLGYNRINPLNGTPKRMLNFMLWSLRCSVNERNPRTACIDIVKTN